MTWRRTLTGKFVLQLPGGRRAVVAKRKRLPVYWRWWIEKNGRRYFTGSLCRTASVAMIHAENHRRIP